MLDDTVFVLVVADPTFLKSAASQNVVPEDILTAIVLYYRPLDTDKPLECHLHMSSDIKWIRMSEMAFRSKFEQPCQPSSKGAT